MARKRIGDLLIERGLITENELKFALDMQKQTHEKLGEVLVNNKIVTAEDMAKTLAFQLEVDFIARSAGDTFYIQSAMHVDTDEKRAQEINSLKRINDSFKKIVIVRDHIMPYKDENGILFIGIKDFLLEENSLQK